MRVIRDIYAECDIEATAMALGNFDGIHNGHQALINETVKLGKKLNLTPAVFTFHPHPKKVIEHIDEPFLIQRFKEKAKIIESFGIDIIVCAHFTEVFAQMEPYNFVKDILIDRMHARAICVGHDYTFGKKASGTTKTLRELSNSLGFELIVIPPFKIDGMIVSSTKIREFLRTGQIRLANEFLGRNYTISGIVREGERRGSSLGFPTANIYPTNEILLTNGVYAAYVYIDSKKYPAAVNVGVNPTFKGKQKHIEAFVFDFDGDLYHKKITIEFIDFIRPERRFKRIADLISQIKQDIKQIKTIL
ncbi:bifunctional riboflavin kinase/FAD synthetase [Hippea sp. KM1]|uniref:bifunctional riboflavin kinase/FAD synthetase n=1 Tax=Hippea sp. KM1 TaxID=944481 RepID=UPI00046D5DE1|nr:bifunctional riboflavin kinase/FAD synthetase [Hippea sp. KM1]